MPTRQERLQIGSDKAIKDLRDFTLSTQQKQPMNHELSTIKIDSEKLTELWNKGVLNDLAYISFALSFDIHPSASTMLDVQDFCNRWSVDDVSEQMVEDGWKKKILKPKTVVNALFILEEKLFTAQKVSVNLVQLSLFD